MIADLNSGLITEMDAKARRIKIQREADFFIELWMVPVKFVKGDGYCSHIDYNELILLQVLRLELLDFGLGIAESMSRFTLLTVGDGLVVTNSSTYDFKQQRVSL